MSRGELAAMVAIAAQEGTLRADDSRLVSNALRYHQIKVEDVMTPRTVVVMVPADTPLQALIHDDKLRVFSRIPVFEGTRDNVVGYILLREVLSALARGVSSKVPVSRFVRKVAFIPEGASLDRALRRLTENREHMALRGRRVRRRRRPPHPRGPDGNPARHRDPRRVRPGGGPARRSGPPARTPARGAAARNTAEADAERERAARAAAEAG